MVVLVMGVSGVGKSTVGQSLAASLNWEFVDADSFHSPDNIAKMSHGIPLGSRDRMPWLFSMQNTIEHWLKTKHHAVLACSALKGAYRNLLISDRTQIKLGAALLRRRKSSQTTIALYEGFVQQEA